MPVRSSIGTGDSTKLVGNDSVLNAAVSFFLPDAVLIIKSGELDRVCEVVAVNSSGNSCEVLQTPSRCSNVNIVAAILGNLYLVLVIGGVP